MNKLRWGIIGLGKIAEAFADGLKQSETGILQAVASRSEARTHEFAERHQAQTHYTSYERLLADPDVDCVYIATPHPMHIAWARQAAQARKHVLIEKPMGMSTKELKAAFYAARANNVFMMEAFMYLCHPQMAKLQELLKSGRVGSIESIEATFGFASTFDPNSRLWNPELGGGCIRDVGCYTLSMVRFVAGCALGHRFAEPNTFEGTVRHHPESGVDCHAEATLTFDANITAKVVTSLDTNVGSHVTIKGSTGIITIDDPWLCKRSGNQDGKFTIIDLNGNIEIVETPLARTSFACEADVCAKSIFANQLEPLSPTAMDWNGSMGNMRLIEKWLNS